MKRTMVLGVVVAGLIAQAGCTYIAAVPSIKGRAFVIKANPFGSTFWHCDATTGVPVCYQVTKVPARGQAQAE